MSKMGLFINYDICFGCHACEKRCPFGVPVIERMGKVKQLHLL